MSKAHKKQGSKRRFGYIDTVLTVDELLSQSEYDLFVKTSIPGHSLCHFLPAYRSSNLHERGHSFHLPDCESMLFKKSFYCPFFIQTCHPQITTNLFIFVLFCVFPVRYDVRLLHLNKDL